MSQCCWRSFHVVKCLGKPCCPLLMQSPNLRTVSYAIPDLIFFFCLEFVLGLARFGEKEVDTEKKLQFLFRVYDLDRDGYISNGELFQVGLNCLPQRMSLMVNTSNYILAGIENDDWKEPERSSAATNSGQNHPVPGQGRGRPHQL